MGRGSWGAVTGSERRAVGARRWHLHTRGPEGASPTPNLTDVETEPEREAFACGHRAVGGTQRSPLLSAHSLRPACLCFSRQGSSSKWAVPPGPPPTSAAGQRGATRQACQEAPSQGAKLCRAGSGSLAPSKESKHGKWEAVESEKLQQVRACEAGASRRDIVRRAWLPVGRPLRSPQLLLAAPRPGVSPSPCLTPAPALAQPAWPALGGPHCLYGKRRQDPPAPAAGLGGTRPAHRPPAAGRQRLRDSQDTGLGGTPSAQALRWGGRPRCPGVPKATSGHSYSQPGSSALFPERQGCGPWGHLRPQKGHEQLGAPRKQGRRRQLRVPPPTPAPPPAPSPLAPAFRARRVGAGTCGHGRVVSMVWCPG